jgi:hypothetical protein
VSLVVTSGVALSLAGGAPATKAYVFDIESTPVDARTSACEQSPGGTRSRGFWQNHPNFLEHVLVWHDAGAFDLGWIEVEGLSEVLGVFWADPNRDASGERRDALAKSRVKAAQHLLAADLTLLLDGHAAVPLDAGGVDIITATRQALRGTDRAQIAACSEALEVWIEEHSDAPVELCPGMEVGSADPVGGADLADITVVD